MPNWLYRYGFLNFLYMVCVVNSFTSSNCSAQGLAQGSADTPADKYVAGPGVGETFSFRQAANGVRIFKMKPESWTKPKRRLVLFATPNGNTIEYTFGCRLKPDDDWHFDIQHIGAQFRYAQKLEPDVDMVLAIVQTAQLSWPAFRQSTIGADAQIRKLVETLQVEFQADETYLMCHSGGGSFLWGWINAHPQLPDSVQRLVYLDANYSYSDTDAHGDKLISWLESNPASRLLVVAYDDREVMFQGKKVVSDDGGTYRASQRMMARFERDQELQRTQASPYEAASGWDDRCLFLQHPNPAKVILHTALVGELNGFAFACRWGQTSDSLKLLSGPRCYSDFILPAPLRDPDASNARRDANAAESSLAAPPRVDSAEGGADFINRIDELDRQQREQEVVAALQAGNMPDYARRLTPIVFSKSIAGRSYTVQLAVMQDYLAVGSNTDSVRIPMTPASARTIAERWNCSCLTAKLSGDVFAAAQHRLAPKPMTVQRDRVATFLEHHRIIENQLKGLSRDGIVVGIKKDIILSNALTKRPDRVAIYGWHYPSGVAIQPMYAGHIDWYTDYSHGVRLISNQIQIDGQPYDYREVLRSELHALLSNEGRIP